jgi:hypothetical protein
MIYSTTITIPSSTTLVNAQVNTLKITSGLIWLVEIYYPPGCCSLARCQIYDGHYQLFPCNIGGYLAGENDTLVFEDLYFKMNPPHELTIKTWNIDDTWDHTLAFRFGLAMTKEEMSRYMPGLAFDTFEKAIETIIANQEAANAAQLKEALSKVLGT